MVIEMKSLGRMDGISFGCCSAFMPLLAVAGLAHSWLNWLQLVYRYW